MECPKFAPDSCRNMVKTFAPGQHKSVTAFAVPGSQSIAGPVVAAPDGTQVALSLTPCTGTQSRSGLFVRDLTSGATHTIVSSTNRCDAFGPAAWSPTGSELVFPLERAGGAPIEMAGGTGCPEGRSYLALASANPSARPGGLKLIDSGRGCVFQAAAFDRVGIVATEGCSHGDPLRGVGSFLGDAYVLQYSRSGSLLDRISIKLGLEQSLITTEPASDDVLITEDQPANEPYPDRDWVWQFNGHRLRSIAHYKAEDAAQVLAIAW